MEHPYKETDEKFTHTNYSESSENFQNASYTETPQPTTDSQESEVTPPQNDEPARDNHFHDGDSTVQNNFTVGGTFRAKKFVHPYGARFHNADELRKEYPNPSKGMWAWVGINFPGDIWICEVDGEWKPVEPTSLTHKDLEDMLKEYATMSWVNEQGFLKQHQSLANYATQSWVTEQISNIDIGSGTNPDCNFSELFEKVNLGTDAAPLWAIKAKYNLYTVGWLSFRGPNAGTGEGDQPITPGTSNLADLKDVTLGNLAIGQTLVWNGTKWVNSTIATSGLDEASLSNYLTSHGYATQSWVNSQSYVTQSWVTAQDYLTQAKSDALYVTAIGTSGNNLTWTKNGTTNNITVPYATRAAFADAVRDPDHHVGATRRTSANVNFDNDCALHYFLATSAMTTSKPGTDGHILHMEWDNSLSWAAQLAVPCDASGSIQYRFQLGASSWHPWRTVVDANNYQSILSSTFYNKTEVDNKLNLKLDKSTFDDLFEKVNLGTDAAPKWAIKAKYNFYADGWLSFRGANDGSGGSAVAGAANLSDLKDVSLGSLAAGQALVWNGAKWVNSTIATSGLDEASLSNYLSSHGYATQSWAEQNFLRHIPLNGGLPPVSSVTTWGNTAGSTVAEWSTADGCALKLKKNNPSAGKISLLIDGTVYINEGVDAVASQAWANGAFVNKAGDTMTGHLTMLAKDVYLKNSTDNSQYVCYGFKNTANAIIAQVGYHNTAKRIIINPVGSEEPWEDAVGKYNLIVGNNELKYNTYTLWHSGNDGHNSRLDADTVDGVHCSDMLHFVALQPQNLDANNIVTTGSCYVPRGDMNNSSWNGYTFTNFPTSKPQGGFMLMNLAEGNYRRQLYTAYNNPDLYSRYYYYNGTTGTWSPWHTLAFTDSTVANANSLGGIAAGDYVTRISDQTISGVKTFTTYVKNEMASMFKAGSDGIYFAPSTDGSLRINTHTNYSYTGYIGRISQDGSLTMGSFIKSGGTASQFLMADGSVTTKHVLLSITNLGWVGTSGQIATINTLAFWNGQYAAGKSNLQYCDRGRFGTMATASASDYLARSGGSMTGQLTIHNGTYNKTLVLSSAGADAKSKGPGILFNGSETDRSQGIVLRHEWYDTFTPGYGLAISRDTSLEAGDANMWLYNTGRYISKVPTGTKPIDVVSTTLCTNLNADLLDGYHVSQVARLTSANASVGAHNLPVYVNGGVINAVSSVGEAFLSWGGQSLNGGFSPVDGAMVGALGANRFAFLKPAGTTFQYSTNSGSTWNNYNLSDTQKSGFFDAGVQQALYASGASNVVATASHQLRVIIATSAARIYTDINKFVINFSTQGCSGTTVTIEKALESTPDNWVTVASNVPLSGWSGWNVVNVPAFRTYGNSPGVQYGRIRFTFKCTGVSSDKSPFVVFCIMAYGGFGWTTPSYMAATGHLYSYDGNQNAYFPGCVRLNNDGHNVGTVWNNGDGQIGVALVNNSNQTPLLVAHRHGAASDVTGANRLFALELLNSGAEMHFAFGGSAKFSMTSAGVFFANGGIWTNGYMSFRGQNTSSDARQKRIIRDIHVPLTTIAKAPNIVFSWLDTGRLDMGSIAQYWQKHLPLSVYVRDNGYLGLDYSKVALACVISMASELLGVKDDVSTLKRELRQLKHENQQLKQQITTLERRIAA